MNKNIGVISMGIQCPIIREGDDLVNIVVNSVLAATSETKKKTVKDFETEVGWRLEETYKSSLDDNDIIGITESVVARSSGNYVTVDEIAKDINSLVGENKQLVLVNPIYSRNRFSMILKSIARAAKEVVIYMPPFDEVGNPSGVNPFTGVNIMDYYKEIVEAEGKKCFIHPVSFNDADKFINAAVIYCGLHDYKEWKEQHNNSSYITLADICSNKCEYGLLGSNKATEEKLKLFPNKEIANNIINRIQDEIKIKTGKHVEVMVYGDGCFKDPVGGIWEFADPVVSPAYTFGLNGTPNEIKIKAFADDQFGNLSGEELTNAIKNTIKEKSKDLKGNMASQGTTPRRYVDLLGSLMDLTSGSGEKGTPIVLIKHYFNNFANN